MSKRLTMPRMDPKIACTLLLQYAEINWIPDDVRSDINSVVEEIQNESQQKEKIANAYKQGIMDCINGIKADLAAELVDII